MAELAVVEAILMMTAAPFIDYCWSFRLETRTRTADPLAYSYWRGGAERWRAKGGWRTERERGTEGEDERGE